MELLVQTAIAYMPSGHVRADPKRKLQVVLECVVYHRYWEGPREYLDNRHTVRLTHCILVTRPIACDHLHTGCESAYPRGDRVVGSDS